MPITNDQEFRTYDLGQAAFIRARGHPLLRTVPNDGRRVAFVFPASAAPTADGFFRDEPVGSWAFWNAIKALKAIVNH